MMTFLILYIFIYTPLITILVPSFIIKVPLKNRKKIKEHHKIPWLIFWAVLNLSIIIPLLTNIFPTIAETLGLVALFFLFVNGLSFCIALYLLGIVASKHSSWDDIIDAPIDD